MTTAEIEFEAGFLAPWTSEQYPSEGHGATGKCRFAPDCASSKRGGPRFPGCPGLPAEFSERMGGPGLGGYARYIPLCRPAASSRFGPDACWTVDALR
jgi:hypothetical protein